MKAENVLPPEVLDQLRKLDTCTVSNAIETFRVRLRNEGYVNGSVRCLFPKLPPTVGYAATGRIRTCVQPIDGKCYYDRIDWWQYVTTIPEPRIVVLQDVDEGCGIGALFGEVHMHICRALGCIGYVTNGAVRDIQKLEEASFPVFAGSIATSHAYAHVIEFGEPVEVGGLKIRPGELLHGDRHGVLSVPRTIAAQVPRAASELLQRERRLIEFLRSAEFSLEGLEARISESQNEPC